MKMKKTYQKPDAETMAISEKDIILTSVSTNFGGPDESKDGLIGWDDFTN